MSDFVYDLGDLNMDCMGPADLTNACFHLRAMLEYGRTKRAAMAARVKGDINRALRYEAACERIYASLPQNWRW